MTFCDRAPLHSSPETGFVRKRSHRYRNLCCLCLLVLVAVVIAAAVGVAIGLGVTEGGSKSSSSGRESLPNSIKAANLMRHLEVCACMIRWLVVEWVVP